MTKKTGKGAAALALLLACLCLAACGKKPVTDEQALSAVKSWCCARNPELEAMAETGEYPVWWEVESSGEREVTVLFRSYTGALLRYYVDRDTGETYVTEFVPGITPEEQRTEETLNVRDWLD